jgi:hypothetical protein
MATDEMHDDRLDEQSCLVVAALADGEPVDPDALRAALDDAAVRDYLVDLVALRCAVATGDVPASRVVHQPMGRSVIGWLSAAAMILVSLGAGYIAGQRTVQAAPAPVVETVVHLESPAAAPKPTRVISLRPGVNWTEKTGEQ